MKSRMFLLFHSVGDFRVDFPAQMAELLSQLFLDNICCQLMVGFTEGMWVAVDAQGFFLYVDVTTSYARNMDEVIFILHLIGDELREDFFMVL